MEAAVPSRVALSAASRLPNRHAVADALFLAGYVLMASPGVQATPSALQNARLGGQGGRLGVRKVAHRHASPLRRDRSFIYKGRCQSLAIPMALSAAAPGKGGVLDRPVEKTTPGRQSEFDVKKSRKMSPPFRVILHNDNYNRREYVVQVLMKVIPGMTVDNAVNIMQEAHVNGLSVVIVCSQSEAEEHCTSLRGNGLRSSIEPASGGC